MGISEFTRGRDRLLTCIDAPTDLSAACIETLAAIRSLTSYSWSAVMPVDPLTLLPTGGVVEGFEPENCAPFWDNELLVPGFNKFNVLARSTDPVATLFEATDGDLRRAPIYTDLWEPLGGADELRAAFLVGTTCWGVATFIRAADEGPFPEHEVSEIRALAPFVARALKAAACKLDADVLGPGAMVVVDGANQIEHLTTGGDELLEDLRAVFVDEPRLPTLVGAIATRTRSSGTSTHLATRMRGASGRWLRVTAAPMEGDGGHVAVMIEPARATDLVPILLESYGLTEREVEIVAHLARGLASKEIAAELSLSVHTVRDHVKAIYDKAGVNSRGELVAHLYAEHVHESFEASVIHLTA